ncbi:MAG TPA: CHAP domain-containing protein [Polyangiaceae bacterium]|nr:CHAP domain-containing protein [Polyangiaceae bacterium]
MKTSSLNALFVTSAAVAAVAVLTSVKSSTRTTAGPTLLVARLPARDAVVRAALSQLGNGDPKRYWDDVLPGVNVGDADWCGAGALWCLHQAGLALAKRWKIESGFLLTPPALPTTRQPEIGDIAYFTRNQHHAVVVGVAPGSVLLVNFNGAGGLVSVSGIDPAQATAFFSIAPLISSANA